MKPFTFSYLRKTIGERNAYRVNRIREQIRRDIKEGILTDETMGNYQRQIDEIVKEIEE